MAMWQCPTVVYTVKKERTQGKLSPTQPWEIIWESIDSHAKNPTMGLPNIPYLGFFIFSHPGKGNFSGLGIASLSILG